MRDELTTAYMLGVEHMRDKLHKQADEIERLRAENEQLRKDVKTAVMGDSAELQDVKRENEKLHREAAIRIDQIKREQEAHLRTIADYNRAMVKNEKLKKALKSFADKYQDNGLSHSMHIFEMKDLLAAKKELA